MKKATQTTDEEREERITMEIIVDAYDESEQMVGWYCYLQDTLKFPFNATVLTRIASSPLSVGDVVEVIDMAVDDICEHDMLVTITWQGKELAIPLKQITAIDGDDDTCQAIGDWHYWVK